MAKQSLISKFFYDRDEIVLTKILVSIGTLAFILLFCTVKIFYWEFLGNIFSSGIPLIMYILYFIALIHLLSKKVLEKICSERYTLLFGILLVTMTILGVISTFSVYSFSKQYSFESTTYFVDHKAKIYHLRCTDKYCPIECESFNLELMQGYEIDESYTLCDWCEKQLRPSDAVFFKRD